MLGVTGRELPVLRDKGLIRRGKGEELREVGPLKLALSEALAKVFRRTTKKTFLGRKKTFYRHVFSCIC